MKRLKCHNSIKIGPFEQYFPLVAKMEAHWGKRKESIHLRISIRIHCCEKSNTNRRIIHNEPPIRMDPIVTCHTPLRKAVAVQRDVIGCLDEEMYENSYNL